MNWKETKELLVQGKTVQRRTWAALPPNARMFRNEATGGYRMYAQTGSRERALPHRLDHDDMDATDWIEVEDEQ